MTDRFQCPEPSEEAVKAGRNAELDLVDMEPQPRPYAAGLSAAYAVDVPRIVRAEVKRALDAEAYDIDFRNTDYYLAQRFGEAP